MAPPRLPIGTQVVARAPATDRAGNLRAAGSVGVMIAAEAGADSHEREVRHLLAELEAAAATSPLPDAPSAGPALSDLLVRLRLATV